MWESLKDMSPSLAVIVPLGVVIIGWCLNEWAKRRWENYKRKEERYLILLKSLPGFYVASQNAVEKKRFIEQIRLAWLYCPDEVIRAGYAFLATVSDTATSSDQERERALAEFVISLRRDLKPGTDLTADDYRNLKST